MAARLSIDLDELVEHWTVLDDERALVDAKYGGTRLGFALLLKHYTRHGRFPIGRAELPNAAIEFVARQLQVPAVDIGAYEWTGRSIERHRAQIRYTRRLAAVEVRAPAARRRPKTSPFAAGDTVLTNDPGSRVDDHRVSGETRQRMPRVEAPEVLAKARRARRRMQGRPGAVARLGP